MVPNVRLEDSVNCSVPIATPGFHAMVVDGRIKARRGTTLAAYAESSTRGGGGGNTSSVVLTSGERVPADLVVLAIGYHLASNVAFLPRAFKSKLVDPRDGQYKLHRLIAHPELPQMGFVGTVQFELLLSAMCRFGRGVAGAIRRWPAGEAAFFLRDAAGHRFDAGV